MCYSRNTYMYCMYWEDFEKCALNWGRTASGEQDKDAGGPYSWQRLGHDHRLSTEKPNRGWEIANTENWWPSKISSCENGRESENRIRLGCRRLWIPGMAFLTQSSQLCLHIRVIWGISWNFLKTPMPGPPMPRDSAAQQVRNTSPTQWLWQDT